MVLTIGETQLAAHVKVFQGGTENLLFNRIFPESVAVEEANQRIRDYVIAEGFNTHYHIDRKTYLADYNKYVLPKAISYSMDNSNPEILHIVKKAGVAYCGERLESSFRSDIRYKETCSACKAGGGYDLE